MAKHRKVTIKGEHKVPIDCQALRKLILYYYKGKNNIELNFDDRIYAWANHCYDSSIKTHIITMSPKRCSYCRLDTLRYDYENLSIYQSLTLLNEYDMTYRIIASLLHELKHAMQCDANPIRYAKCQDDKHPVLKNPHLRYKYSVLETEAEGWALLNLHKAIERYEQWCDEGRSDT